MHSIPRLGHIDQKRKKMMSRGYTLLELLTTLTLAAVLLTIAIPSYSFFVNTTRLSTVTNDLVSSLQLARSEAIKRGQRVTVCKTSSAMNAVPSCDTAANWQQGWLIFVDSGIRGIVDTDDNLLRVQGSVSPAATITANNYNAFISYLPRGISQGPNGLANGTLKICVANNQRDIIINITGRIRLASSTC